MDITRSIVSSSIHRVLNPRFVLILFGPRQSGKTTLAKKIVTTTKKRWLELNGDDPETVEELSKPTKTMLDSLIGSYEGFFLDEAQRIPEIGLTLKRIHDDRPDFPMLITGSSSLEIGDKTREALTGRVIARTLYPISTSELSNHWSPREQNQHLEERLIFGSYPALWSLPGREEKIQYIKELTSSYLYKDILDLSGIRNPRKLRDLLRALAYQVGNEVSFSELGSVCGLSTDTVIHYVDLLEKSFVLMRLGSFNRNLRNEISTKSKIYFLDNGVRNALIDDFRTLNQRNDQGPLWENFLIMERTKENSYAERTASSWFWRLVNGPEIDYIESTEGRLDTYEFKWGRKTPKIPKAFSTAYPDHTFSVVSQENWLEFAGGSHAFSPS